MTLFSSISIGSSWPSDEKDLEASLHVHMDVCLCAVCLYERERMGETDRQTDREGERQGEKGGGMRKKVSVKH